MDIQSLRFTVDDLSAITDGHISAETIEAWTKASSNYPEAWQVPVGEGGYQFWHLLETAIRAKIMRYNYTESTAGMVVRRRAARHMADTGQDTGWEEEDAEKGFPILPEFRGIGSDELIWYWLILTDSPLRPQGDQFGVGTVAVRRGHSEVEESMEPDERGLMLLNVSPVIRRAYDYAKARGSG